MAEALGQVCRKCLWSVRPGEPLPSKTGGQIRLFAISEFVSAPVGPEDEVIVIEHVRRNSRRGRIVEAA